MACLAPKLLVRDTAGNTREVEVDKTPFTMGRQGDNELVLLDSRISRRHARIVQDTQGYLIEDLGSRHGTYLNGAQVKDGRLRSGDQIGLGVGDAYTLAFILKEPELPALLGKLEKTGESPTAQLQHLGLLLQMSQMMCRAPALEEVLIVLVDSALSITGADRGLLFLKDGEGGLQLRLARAQGGIILADEQKDYSESVVQKVATTGREELVLEEAMTGRASQETGTIQRGIRGVVAVPLQKLPVLEASGETIVGTTPEMLGVLYLDSRSRATSLTGLDRQVLQTLAVEGATVIENARLFRLTREQERIQHELSLARNIQQSLLPRSLPESDYFELAAFTVPSFAVGGDYYDVVTLPGGRFGFTVADVSGKGLAAAMMAAMLQGAFAAVAAGDPALEELCGRVNAFLCERTPSEMFATMFYGVLGRDGEFRYVNAGHNSPLVLRKDGSIELLESSNFPLGFFPKIPYEPGEARLSKGDLILIFSDGLPEAQNLEGELLGEERVKSLVAECPHRTAKGVSDYVLEGVRKFVGAAPASDDLTLLVIRRSVK
jgi:phosphoserine phosphatase RsbU/P